MFQPTTRIHTAVSDGGDLCCPESVHAIIRDIYDARHINDLSENQRRTLFDAERITIFAPNNDGNIVSKVAMHLNTSQRLKLPANAKSIVGYVRQEKATVNIANVYDDAEFKHISPSLRFFKAMGTQTGFFTKRGLTFPMACSPCAAQPNPGKTTLHSMLRGITDIKQIRAVCIR